MEDIKAVEQEVIDETEIIEDIEDLEDYVERLVASNKVVYDESFHHHVIQKHTQLVAKIKNSALSNEDKGFMTETIAEMFKEHVETQT